ncbi:MAG: tetratricopeptide TPR_4, partial [uncultured bacterium]
MVGEPQEIMQEPSASHNRLRPACRKCFVLFWCFWAVLLFQPTIACSSSKPAPPEEPSSQEKKETIPLLTAEALWSKAAEARKNKSWEEAAALYRQYFDRFQEKENGEEALGEAAKAAKAAATKAASEAPDWEMVRDLYRMYTTEYPASSHNDEAFFEVGLAHYHMRFYREAFIYFKKFEERYPDSPLLQDVLLWRGKTVFALGRYDEAINLFRQVTEESSDRALMFAAMKELGDTQTAAKDFAGALVTYSTLMQKHPAYYLEDPGLLLKLGLAQMHVGKNSEGRKYLFYYLNIDPGSTQLADVLFEIAESYRRENDENSALKL